MKKIYFLSLVILLATSSISYGLNQNKYIDGQSQAKTVLSAIVQDSQDIIQFKLNAEVLGDQGILTISDASGRIIFEEEVEVLSGQIFKTVPLSQIRIEAKGILIVELKSAKQTFKTTLSI